LSLYIRGLVSSRIAHLEYGGGAGPLAAVLVER
jgi:hypothetical protein